MAAIVEPAFRALAQGDLMTRASAVEHALKHAFSHAPSRLIRMQMDEASISVAVFFQKGEIFLRQLFVGCLSASELKYKKDEGGISLQVDMNKNPTAFLTALHVAVKSFNDQRGAMQERSQKVLTTGSRTFFATSSNQKSSSQRSVTPFKP